MANTLAWCLSVLGVLTILIHESQAKPIIRQDIALESGASPTQALATDSYNAAILADRAQVKPPGREVSIGSGASILSKNVGADSDDIGATDQDIRKVLENFFLMFEGKTQSTCMKDRILNASGITASSPAETPWQQYLAPAVSEALKQQHDYAGSGTAVLVTGQVRTGVYPDVVKHMRAKVFDALKKHSPNEAVEVFALLAFTSGGYHAWQQLGHLDQTTDIKRSDVEQMLHGYGVKYTLEEFTGANHFPDFHAEGCCDASHPDRDCGNNQDMSQQWLKVHGAIEMMRAAEKTRGQQYANVVRLRPDIQVWGELQLQPSWPHNVPVVCTAGGGGADALLTMPRWAAEAVDGMWRMTEDCPMPGVDECRTKDLVAFCKTKMYMGHELCDHFLWLGLMRHGVAVSGCGQGLTFVRPKN